MRRALATVTMPHSNCMSDAIRSSNAMAAPTFGAYTCASGALSRSHMRCGSNLLQVMVIYGAMPTKQQLGSQSVNLRLYICAAACRVCRQLTLVNDMPCDVTLAAAISHMPDLQVQPRCICCLHVDVNN
jgi:hypothetical protein